MATDEELLLIRIEASQTKMEKELNRALSNLNGAERKIARSQANLTRRIEQNWAGLGRSVVPSLGAIGAALSTHEILQYADAWRSAGNKLASSGTPMAEVQQRLEQLAEVATNSRTSFDATAAAYQRLRIATERLGVSEQDAIRYTELINKSFVAGGASASEAASAALQLSQALSSGALQGDELRSLRENAPLLARAIADAMGTSIGGLKQLGAEGKITADIILKALDGAAVGIESRFDKTQMTVGQAFTNLETAFTQFVGANSSGALDEMARSIEFLAKHLEDAAKVTAIAAAALGPAGLAGAARVASTAVGALWALMAANPMGVVLSVLSAASVALVLYGSKTTEAERVSGLYEGAIKRLDSAMEEAATRQGKLTSETRSATIEQAKAAIAVLDQNDALIKQAKAIKEVQLAQQSQRSALDRYAGSGGEAAGFSASIREADRQLEANAQRRAELMKRLKVVQGTVAAPSVQGVAPPNSSTPKGVGGRNTYAARLDVELARANSDVIAAQDRLHAQLLEGSAGYQSAVIQQIENEKAARLAEIEAERAARVAALDSKAFSHGDYQQQIADINAIAAARKRQADIEARAQLDATGSGSFLRESLVQADQQIKAYSDETAALGLVAGAAANLSFVQSQLNEAKRRGINLTDEEVEKIMAQGAAIGASAQAAHDAAVASSDNVQALDTLRGGLSEVGVAGVHGFSSLKDAAGQFLRTLLDTVAQLYVMKPLLNGLLGEAGTSGGGIIGTLLSGIPGFANGTNNAPGGLALVGERGPELVNLPKGSQVIPNLPQLSQPSSNLSLRAEYTVHVTGTTDKELLAQVQQGVQAMIRQNNEKVVPSLVAAANKNPRRR